MVWIPSMTRLGKIRTAMAVLGSRKRATMGVEMVGKPKPMTPLT